MNRKLFYPMTLTTVETTSEYSTKTEKTTITDLYSYYNILLYNKVEVIEHSLLTNNNLEITITRN